jgi:signal transduction histidine kinase/ligand-binding sensor domain-containing protein
MARYAAPLVAAFCLIATLIANAEPQFVVRTWRLQDGLPTNALRSIAQAGDGYMWIGTAEGVVRFDGMRFTDLPDTKLAHMPVSTLFPLANGEIWDVTSGGTLIRGRGTRLKAIEFPADPGVPPISQVVLADAGDVIVVRGTNVWQIPPSGSPQLAEQTPAVKKLLQDDVDYWQMHGRLLPRHGPEMELRDSRGRLWESMSGQELAVGEGQNQPTPVDFGGNPPVDIRSISEDREGNIWLATKAEGLWQLRTPRVQTLKIGNNPADDMSSLVMEDHSGALWVANGAASLECLTGTESKQFPVGKAPQSVAALCETGSGAFWAVAHDGNVFVLEDGTFNQKFVRQYGSVRVNTVTSGNQGQIWLGGLRGLSVSDGNTVQRIDGLEGKRISAIANTEETTWAGTENGELFRGTGDKFVRGAPADAFSDRRITCLLPDTDGSLWVGTLGSGLFQLRDGKLRAIPMASNGLDPRITCILDDGAGFLWLGTFNGICRLSKTEINADSSGDHLSPLVLDQSDGLPTSECALVGQPAGWRGRDGTIWICTAQGVAEIFPNELTFNRVPPPVVIEDAATAGHSIIRNTGIAKAGPGRARLEFQFTALSFSAPEKVRFRVKLDGLDDGWRDVGHQRSFAYEAVPPGSYQFHVIADNGDGIWNETGAMLPVEVMPHYWETRWFQWGIAFAVAALAVGVGALIMRARMRGRLLRLEKETALVSERTRIARDMHDELGASLTRITMMSDLATLEPQSNGSETKRFGEIAKASREISSTLDQIVWAVNPRNDTIERLVGYIGEFATEYLDGAGIPLKLELPMNLPAATAAPELRHHVLLGIKESLNNIVKYAHAGTVTLRISFDEGSLNIAIMDNGRGFDPAAVSPFSNGLRNMEQRFAAMGGSAQIESGPGNGCVVTFHIPVG